jgi:hypothetical protein
MPLPIPYAGIPPELLIRQTLYYISQNITAEPELGDYIYDLPDPWDNKTEGDFDLMVWNDTRPKPTWSDIITYWETAWNWSVENGYINFTTDQKFTYFEEYFMEVEEPNVEALQTGKADKTTTVNGHALSSNVTVTKGDVGLGNADNTSDANKPVSTATQTALDGKVPNSRTLAGLDLSANRSASALRVAIMSTQTHIADAPVDLVTDCPTDADTNANLLSLLTIGAALNSNATKQNSGFTKCNANFVKVNTGFGRMNSILDALEVNNALAA